MRYLKKFNESIKDDLTEFCNDNLVFLIDAGFMFFVNSFTNGFYSIKMGISSEADNYNFTWDDIKEDLIPFVELLDIEYRIMNKTGIGSAHIIFRGDNGYPNLELAIDDILEDNVPNNHIFDQVTIYLKERTI